MSATRSQVVLFSTQAFGLDRPQPRWSKRIDPVVRGIEEPPHARASSRRPARRAARRPARRRAGRTARHRPGARPASPSPAGGTARSGDRVRCGGRCRRGSGFPSWAHYLSRRRLRTIAGWQNECNAERRHRSTPPRSPSSRRWPPNGGIPHGKFKPLHMLNPCRLDYIVDQIAAEFGRDPKAPRPFAGLRLLDIGCGGGLLAEPMARLGAEVVGVDAAAAQHPGRAAARRAVGARDRLPPRHRRGARRRGRALRRGARTWRWSSTSPTRRPILAACRDAAAGPAA